MEIVNSVNPYFSTHSLKSGFTNIFFNVQFLVHLNISEYRYMWRKLPFLGKQMKFLLYAGLLFKFYANSGIDYFSRRTDKYQFRALIV